MIDRAVSGPWTDRDLPRVAAWLDEIDAPLDSVVEAIHRPFYYAPIVRSSEKDLLLGCLLPHLSVHREIGRALAMRCLRSLGRGDLIAAIDDWGAAARLARLQTHEPLLISNLVGIAIGVQAHEMYKLILQQPGLTKAHLNQISAAYTQLPPHSPIAKNIFELERALVLDILIGLSRGWCDWGQVLGPNSPPASHLSDQVVERKRSDVLTEITADPAFDLERALRRANTFWDRWSRGMPQEFGAQKRYNDAIEKELKKPHMDELLEIVQERVNGGLRLSGDTADAVADFYLDVASPVVQAALLTEWRHRAHIQIESVALSLAMFRADHGGFPAALAALVPKYLQGVPDDCFTEGQALRYRTEEGACVVYSVGKMGGTTAGSAITKTAIL